MTAAGRAIVRSAGVLALSALPVHAAGFASPSGNILCYVERVGAPLVCLVFEADWNLTKEDTPDCDLDRTRTVALPARGAARAYWSCHGDVFWPYPLGTLEYGSTWSLGPVGCSVERSGVACSNASGHVIHIRRVALTME